MADSRPRMSAMRKKGAVIVVIFHKSAAKKPDCCFAASLLKGWIIDRSPATTGLGRAAHPRTNVSINLDTTVKIDSIV
jgi:hypothetical protein